MVKASAAFLIVFYNYATYKEFLNFIMVSYISVTNHFL